MHRSSPEADREAAWQAVVQMLGGPPSRKPSRDRKPRGEITPRPDVSVTVLTGFLGAGKTTLLCRLLEQAPLRITAIVNDVASINVDAAIVRSRNAETIEFQNGCACCALQTDLRESLEEISAREEPPQAVVIEASGIADPMGIAQTVANVPGTALDGIVTLVDANTFHSSASDPGTASVFARQLAAAHLVVLTKTEPGSELETLAQSVGSMAPGRPVLAWDDLFQDGGQAACEILLGAALRGARPAPAEKDHAHSGFAVETREWSAPLEASAFFEWLDRVPRSLYRIKGSVWLRDGTAEATHRVDLQAVGPRWRVTDSEKGSPGSHLVLIGRAQDPAFAEYAAQLDASQALPRQDGLQSANS